MTKIQETGDVIHDGLLFFGTAKEPVGVLARRREAQQPDPVPIRRARSERVINDQLFVVAGAG